MTSLRSFRLGVTLLETLVAATIVLLVLLSLLGVIAFGLEGVRNAEGHQDAVLYARQLFEVARENGLAQMEISPPGIGFDDPADARIPLSAPPFDSLDEFPENSGYTRRMVSRRLSDDPGLHGYKVYRIEVAVFWEVKGRESSFRLVGYHRVP